MFIFGSMSQIEYLYHSPTKTFNVCFDFVIELDEMYIILK